MHAGVLPGLDEEGRTLASDGVQKCKHCLNHIPGIPRDVVAAQTPICGPARWDINAVTYNCTTITKEHDRQCLAAGFHNSNIHLVGLQETRTDPGIKYRQGKYVCICAPAHKGNFGCQLWVHTELASATLQDGTSVLFEPHRISVLVREPRLLIVMVPAGSCTFACVVAHSLVAEAYPEEAAAWWTHFETQCRRIPRNAVPLLFLDTNARFHKSEYAFTVRDGIPKGANAVALQAFANEHLLASTRSRNMEGEEIVTWCSPQGYPAQIDHLLFPQELADSAQTLGVPREFVDPLGFDHRPLQVTLTWDAIASSNAEEWRWNRDKMRSVEGRLTLAHIFRTCPNVPWQVHPDDHLQLVNDHICSGLRQHFALDCAQSRRRHVSEELWAAVRHRRQARRISHRNKVTGRRLFLQLVLKAWRALRQAVAAASSAQKEVSLLGYQWAQRCHKLCIANARLGRVVNQCTQLIHHLDQHDAAAYTRKVLRESRCEGPAAMAAALRGVLKQGRRYKPPRVAPALHVARQDVVEAEKVQEALECHFAAPERGHRAAIAEIASSGHRFAGCDVAIDAAHLPTLAQVAAAFLRLKPNKAAGLSSFPAEVYTGSALEAAAAPNAALTQVRRVWSVAVPMARLASRCVAEAGQTRGEALRYTTPLQRALGRHSAGSWPPHFAGSQQQGKMAHSPGIR